MKSARPWGWRDKLRVKLFPPIHGECPEAPASYKDALIVTVISDLSLLDRLRVFLVGRIRVEVRTVTENVIGDHKTSSVFCALPPKWSERS